MEWLFEWLKILFFGSFIVLTDRPIDLGIVESDVLLRSPISAITSEASLYVDVTSMVPKDQMTIDLSRKWVEINVTPGCVKAILRGDSSISVSLEFDGVSSFEPDKLFLILVSSNGIPVSQKYKKLSLTSCIPLNKVHVYWKNYRK